MCFKQLTSEHHIKKYLEHTIGTHAVGVSMMKEQGTF